MPAPNSRDLVRDTIRFRNTGRMPCDLPPSFGSDFARVELTPSPDERPSSGPDQWGAVWKNIGVCHLGEVERFPLTDWRDFGKLKVPDITEESRWNNFAAARQNAGDKYLLACGVSIYERVHFIRGLQNTWIDIQDCPDKLCALVDLLVRMNLEAIERYAPAGVDGLFLLDDWGLQNSLMISPDSWREIWKPRYHKIFQAAHGAGLQTFLHSCGFIVDILDDLIEVGLDVIQMDQQENMGLDALGERFGGRVTFFCPVDIQNTMARGDEDEIRAYCRRMARSLGRPGGGFIPMWYSDPAGAGHSEAAVEAMSSEFLAIADEQANR